jgi:hypothetical protein
VAHNVIAKGKEVLVMAHQGRALSENQIRRIISLLASTEMTIPEIAERMGCSRSAIVSVNRHHGIRNYAGHRSTWTCSGNTTPRETEKDENGVNQVR